MRLPAKALSLGALAVASWLGYEGFSSKPYIPVPGDRPTIGNGSTFYEDGTPVKLSDPVITRQRAKELATHELENTYFACVQKSLGDTPVNQTEIDLATDFAGQYGCAAWGSSQMLANLKAGQYAKACQSYRDYRFMTSPKAIAGWEPYKSKGVTRWRFDCSTPGNKVCRGVWLRQADRIKNCEAAL